VAKKRKKLSATVQKIIKPVVPVNQKKLKSVSMMRTICIARFE
jgi:hypothetical protein